MKTFDEALAYLLEQATPIKPTETRSVSESEGFVLAQGIVSDINVPPHNNSMMDGYVMNSQDFDPTISYPVSQRICAGSVGEALKPGTIARIFTGALIPNNADMVIMQEETEEDGEKIKFTAKTPQVGQNIRTLGEDISKGCEILKKGQQLQSQYLGLISSIGVKEVVVYQPLTIATFTTGDELLEPGDAPQAGKIYNANRYVLSGLVPKCGFKLIDLGRVEDTLEATIEAMKKAASVADVVVTTGGVSVGEEDHIKPAIESLGALDMWKVKMKPGKPLAYGKIEDTPFIGLPGNPVSAFATFQLFAKPYLMKLQGQMVGLAKPLWLEADFDWLKTNFRREFARAKWINKDQTSKVDIFPNQGSGVLTSVSWAEGFVVIPENTQIHKGDRVAFYPFNAFYEEV